MSGEQESVIVERVYLRLGVWVSVCAFVGCVCALKCAGVYVSVCVYMIGNNDKKLITM